MTYAVTVRKAAERALKQLDKPVQARIAPKLRALADNPRPPGVIPLVGYPYLRIKVGDYRIVYTVDDEQLLIEIFAIAHRKSVYRNL